MMTLWMRRMAAGLLAAAAAGAGAELIPTGGMTPSAAPELRAARKAASALVVGDVKTILDGVSTGSRFLRVEPGTFTAALGAAALTPDPAAQGETLVLGDTSFVKTVEPARQYRTLSSATGFWTGFVAGLERGARPAARYEVRGEGHTMEEIFRQLAGRHGPMFAVIGKGHFRRLEASAVKRAPCWGEPILGAHKERYFHPPAVEEEVDALFFGLALRSPDDATSATGRIFYINPDDRSATGLQSHTHFARVRSLEKTDLRDPAAAAAQADEVAHLLTQSRLSRGELDVYELGEVKVRGPGR